MIHDFGSAQLAPGLSVSRLTRYIAFCAMIDAHGCIGAIGGQQSVSQGREILQVNHGAQEYAAKSAQR
jgi:hypothetical protein